MNQGIVKWFNTEKGFGFISANDGSEDLFVHYSEIKGQEGHASLKDGDQVEFEIGRGQKGPCAVNVTVV